ncbi:hypothetical protein [Anaerocolumna sp. MB42-C2]|uniref:hypothetical protein n=1 Tax=Anaerocolumna sp. MB42-C2 TaxID=3070997 RepID=UPI0027E05518|nr:hypothetical protein [Anaerocolumna sp. MB42-C2]WMJ88819.1 hypothetical protein RBU59_04695 [Anaerocolumna sp. MB42-C2]
MLKDKEFYTEIGLLTGVVGERIDKDGILRSCMFKSRNKISHHGEIYIPKYESGDVRTRYRDAVSFYKSGKLKSLYLNERQEIDCPVGKMKAEFVSFYESGRYLRIFPVYGQINGYWSEREEAELLTSYSIEIGEQKIEAKISCIVFYESGAVKSLTLWPGENVDIKTPYSKIKVRFGISFYESGAVESIEPENPVHLTYDACSFFAYDNHPLGIHGEKNSLSFYENGTLKALKTTITAVVLTSEKEEIRIAPEQKISQTDIDAMEVYPINIEFLNQSVRITDSSGYIHEYSLLQFKMGTEQVIENLYQKCGDCSNCSKCSTGI